MKYSNDQKGIFKFLLSPQRSPKPRTKGITLIDDRCLPTNYIEEVLKINSDLIDYAKIVDHAGMLMRYSTDWIIKRLKLYKDFNVRTLPSGVSFEMSCIQKKSTEFFNVAKQLGFTTIEISDDVMPPLSSNERRKLIKSAQSTGLEVLTEVGRKFPEEELNEKEVTETIKNDLDMAVSKVTIEASEIKASIELKSTVINKIMDNVGYENIILEVGPNGWPHLHKWAVKNFGSEVNLGNVELEHIIHIEGMRVGLHRNVEYNFINELVEKFS